MNLIGIAGKKRSGKNTVADIIKSLTTTEVVQHAFADALKDEVAKACGVSRDFIEKNKPAFRLILQGWGTEFRRRLCTPDYWEIRLAKKILSAPDECIAIVTDVRFPSEADLIKRCGGTLVCVKRPMLDDTDSHASETSLDDYKHFDYVIENNSTLNNLKEDVKRLLHNMKIK